jgi:hypothetical protein
MYSPEPPETSSPDEQEEAVWREVIRASVEMAFASRRLIVSQGVQNRGEIISYEPS